MVAHVRVSSRAPARAPLVKLFFEGFDDILRRATSLERFVLHVEDNASRKEVVLTVAGVRRSPTDRTDTTILPLLRRLLPEVERGKWVQLPADGRGLDQESVFVDYEVVERDKAEEHMRAILAMPDRGFTSTTELPPVSRT